MKKFLLLVVICTYAFKLSAQNINPGEDRVFRMLDLTTIELTMDPADAEALLDMNDVESNQYFHAALRIINSEIDSTRTDVGVRLRGNTSRYKTKKSIKIDFREWGGEKFENYKKLNLKAETNDVSMAREMLSLFIYRSYNIPAARSFYVKLYINEEYKGIYLSVEQIDDEFVDRRYGNEAGNLYKCYWGANLADEGVLYNDHPYELKLNELVNDRTKLSNLIYKLNSSSSSTLPDNIEPIFALDNYLRQMAVEALVGHWDGYSFNQNNFYLYEDPTTAKIHFIPYDVDNTFGIDYVGPDWGTRNVQSWSNSGYDLPLTQKVLSVNEYFESYCRHLMTVLRDVFNEDFLFPVLDDAKATIKDAINDDPLFSADNGFTFSDYNNSYEQAWGAHIYYGVKEYIRTRKSYALNQLTGYEPFPESSSIDEVINNSLLVFPNPVKEGYFFVKGVKADQNEEVELFDYVGRKVNVNYLQVGKGEYRLIFGDEAVPGIYILRIGNQHKKILVE